MVSQSPIRNPKDDHMLTPQNAALVIIDFQPTQVSSIQSRDRHQLVANILRVAKIAKVFGLPTVLSTVNVKTGINKPMIKPIMELFPDIEPIDRTSINAWEDNDFVNAVRSTARKKLLMAALWTEVCLVFPALDAMHDGFDVYPIVDAVAGTSSEAHDFGLQRIIQAGAKPVTWIQMACELQRDWNRTQTAGAFAETLFAL